LIFTGGLEPVGDARMKFEMIYYVIGLLYLIFDLEIIFLFPLATVMLTLNNLLAFWVVLILIIVLTIGFLYEWFHGALMLSIYMQLHRIGGDPLPLAKWGGRIRYLRAEFHNPEFK
jgi:hypothetical protein